MFLRTLSKKLLQRFFSAPQNCWKLLHLSRFTFSNDQSEQIIPEYRRLDSSTKIESFADLQMPIGLKEKLKKLFPELTQIQKRAAKAIMDGEDLIGISQTGSGKTLAYALPILLKLAKSPRKTNRIADGPRYTIIAPTRQLSLQIVQHLSPYTSELNLKIGAAYGGQRKYDQVVRLHRGVDVFVCTPGRLNEFLKANFTFKRLQHMTIDEADRILTIGYEFEMNEILKHLPTGTIQTTLFSATWNKRVHALTSKYLKPSAKYLLIGPSEKTLNRKITQLFEYINGFDKKLQALVQLLKQNADSKCIIFCNSKGSVVKVSNLLTSNGFQNIVLHGELSQDDRIKHLEAFKRGKTPLLVSSDLAAYGLDIKNVICVINFETPLEVDRYIHRIGRTGRGSNTGYAITYLSDETTPSFFIGLQNTLRANNMEVPAKLAEWAEKRITQITEQITKKKNQQLLQAQQRKSKHSMEENRKRMEEYFQSQEWKQ